MNTNLDMMQMMQQMQQMTPEQMQLMMATMANIMTGAAAAGAESMTAAIPHDDGEAEYVKAVNAAGDDAAAGTGTASGTYYRCFEAGRIDCIKTADAFQDDTLYRALFKLMTDEIKQRKIQYQLEQKAKDLGGTALATMFRQTCTAAKRKYKKEKEEEDRKREADEADLRRQEEQNRRAAGHKTEYTNLPDFVDGNRYLGEEWTANDNGIFKIEEVGKTTKLVEACGRPFVVNKLLVPIDGGDGIDRVEIAYDSERGWQRRVIPRDMLVNATEAIKLAKFSVDITTDMARPFTNCMASMLRESSKRRAIPSIPSSRKLAIMKDKEIILPFRSKEFVFERESEFPGLLAAITPNEADAGYNETEYLDAYRAMRKKNLPGFNLMTAAILSSPVVCMTNANGFVFNMYGPTGCGKSFLLSIGTTLFGDYHHENGSGYVKTPLMTNTAAETMCDTLHCYPLIIDDYNLLTEQKDRDKFNKNIMLFSNGLGKERATKTLALVKPGFWKLATFIAAEQSIREQARQGGVSNRLYEITLDEQCPMSKEDIDKIMEPFNRTHAFAGIKFIEILNKMGVDAIREMVTGYAKKITEKMKEKGLDKTNKQIDIAAILLATDEIAKNELFHDDVQLSIDEVIKWMADNDDVKQEARFYNTIIDKIYANPGKFEGLASDSDDMRGGYWGIYESEIITREVDGKQTQDYVKTIGFIQAELKRIAQEEGASLGAFKDYLKRNGLLIKYKGSRDDTVKRDSNVQGRRINVLRFIIPDDRIPEKNKPEKPALPIKDEDIPFN